ncbi:glycosyltransferase [Salisaeta longa]|uniref:glycosyltransferase n=1 Tax=Salisaeta longa TaxID=503170 RepID=UPI0003B578BA|nr:glycosyltransferase [Salisaeta longa]
MVPIHPTARMAHVVHLTTVHHVHDPRILHRELKTLQAAGHRVVLVGPHERHERIDGVPVRALPRTSGRYRRLVLQAPAFRAARAENADVYHIHDPELIPLAYILKHVTGAAVIYDMHENYRTKGGAEGRLVRGLERWCFRWVDHVLLAERGYRPILSGTPTPHTVVENYFQPPTATPPPPHPYTADRPLRLVCSGVLTARRGLFELLELVQRCAATGTDCQIRLVGWAPIAAERTAALRQLDAHSEWPIAWIGRGRYVNHRTIQEQLRWADAGLALYDNHPNFACSYPTKFYEYMHYGLPILYSDLPLWRTFMERHGCGVAVPVGDIDALLAAVQRWQASPDRWAKLSEAARHAAPSFYWEQMGERLLTAYDAVLTRR